MRKLFLMFTFVFLAGCMNNAMLIYKNPENYNEYKEKVKFVKNINYHSQYPNGVLDIIYPREENKNNKIIIWVHGGSYIEGDKEKTEPYMVLLANEGFTAVNLNYALAPDSHYPVQLKQIEEAYKFIKEHADEYKLNLNKVYFGGDSAGAQIVSQFVNLQTNPEYLNEVNENTGGIRLEKVIDKNNIEGVILLCGLYNFRELLVFNPSIIKLGKLYFGTKDINNPNIDLCGIIDKISPDYPPVFITDGNVGSFQWQAKDFAQRLTEKGIYVKKVFYDIYNKDIPVLYHQYQFNLDNESSKKTFIELIDFLNNQK